MKRYKISLLALVWGLVFLQAILNITAKNDYKLVEAFQASQSIPIEGKVVVSGSLGKQELSRHTRQKLLIDFARQVGIRDGYEIESWSEDAAKMMTLKREGKNGSIWFRLTSVADSHYMTTEISIEDANKVFTIKRELERAMHKNGIRTTSNVYLRGDFDHVLTRKEKDEIEKKLFAILQAKVVSKYTDEYSDTIYGYSPRLSDYYERDGKRMNLQMVIHYNEGNENSQLYLAVPFYNESY